MTDNSDIREKSRAVFLAAVMVLSMVAMSATFVGGVAALNADSLQDGDTDVTIDDRTAGVDASYEINATIQANEDTTANYISVGFDNTDADPSSITAGDVAVEANDATGDPLEDPEDDVTVEGTFALNDETLVINVSEDTIPDTTGELGVTIDDVTNPSAGDYVLTLGLHDEADNEPVTPAFTDATDSYSTVDDRAELAFTGGNDGLTVSPSGTSSTAFTTGPADRASGNIRTTTLSPIFAENNENTLGVPYGLGPFEEAGTPNTVTVDHSIDINTIPSTGDGTEELTLDFSESVNAGLDLELATGDIEQTFVDLINRDRTGDAEISTDDVSVTNTSSSVTIEYALDSEFDTGSAETVTFSGISFEVEDPIEGLDIDGSDALEHDLTLAGAEDDDAYRLVDTGEIALDVDDFNIQNDNTESVTTTFPDSESTISNDGINAFAGTDITIRGNSDGDSFSVFTAEESSDSGNNNLVTGEELDISPVGTAPGQATTIDTAEFPDENGEYFIQYDQASGSSDLFYIDLRPLNLDAGFTEDEVDSETDLEIDVSSSDIGSTDIGGQVQAWFYEAGDEPSAANTIAVDTDELNGDGEATLSADPVDDLDGTGEYQAIVAHVESGEFVLTETVDVTEPLDENVDIVRPRQTDDPYTRGDLIEFEANLEGTDTATITFGDRGAGQNLELNITVQTEEVGGTAEFYLNTFQIGDGPVKNDTQNDDGTSLVRNTDIEVDDWGDKQHGVITQDGTSLVNVEAHESIAIGGGSNADTDRKVVIGAANYDLTASPGETAYTEDEAISTDNSIVRIEERTTGDLEAWEAPTPGDEAAIEDIEFVDAEDDSVFDIEAAVDQGLITPQENVTAENDILVLQFQATGLEGLLANQSQAQGDLDEFLNRNEDHFVTDAFFGDDQFTTLNTNQSQDQVQEIVNASLEDREPENNQPLSEDPVFGTEATLDLTEEEVLAGTNNREGVRDNLNEYFLTITVDEDSISDLNGVGAEGQYAPNDVDTRDDDDEIPTASVANRPTQFNTTFELSTDIGGNSSAFPENGLFGDDVVRNLNWELANDTVALDDVQETEDGPRLFVPAQNNYTIEGETQIAAGTSMTSQTQTASGEDPAFFYPNEFTVEYVEDAPNTISFSEDFFDNEEIAADADFAGADFRMTIRRSRLPGNLIPNAPRRGLPGTISEITTVNAHTFEDQQTNGATVNVGEVNVSESAVVEIRDADGNALGSSEVPEGESTNVTVVLDEELEVGQEVELTSVILDADGNEFSEGPATQTATVEVTEDSGVGTTFLVENLQPVSATVEPGATVEEITADVTNIGSAGEQTVELLLDDEVQDSQTVSLENGESTTVTFEDVTAPDSEGTYTHAIASEDQTASGQLTVEAPEEANFQLSLDSGPSEVETGADITAEVTVENTGGQEATQTITFTFAGEEVGSTEVTLGAGETATESFSASAPDEAGDYDWEIASDDDSISQTLTVTDGGSEDGDDGDSSDDGGPGFGIAAALVALLGAALLAYRRQQN